MFLPLVSILQYFVGKPVNKLDLFGSRWKADPYTEEIILVHAISLSEFISLSVIHLIKLYLLYNVMKSGVKCDKVSINLNDPARDARHLKRYVFCQALFAESRYLFSFDPDIFFIVSL